METIRKQLIHILTEKDLTLRDMSVMLRIKEKDVLSHLPNISKTLSVQNKKLIIHPFRCLACGYEFRGPRKLKKPGKCPICRKSRLEEPVFGIR